MSIKRYALTVLFSNIVYGIFNFVVWRMGSSLPDWVYAILWSLASMFYIISISVVDIVGFFKSKTWIIDDVLLSLKIREANKKYFPNLHFLAVIALFAFLTFCGATGLGSVIASVLKRAFPSRVTFCYLMLTAVMSLLVAPLLAVQKLSPAVDDRQYINEKYDLESLMNNIIENKFYLKKGSAHFINFALFATIYPPDLLYPSFLKHFAVMRGQEAHVAGSVTPVLVMSFLWVIVIFLLFVSPVIALFFKVITQKLYWVLSTLSSDGGNGSGEPADMKVVGATMPFQVGQVRVFICYAVMFILMCSAIIYC